MPSNASYLFYKEWVVLFNIKQETLPREELEALQLRRLRDLCDRVYANVPFYRKRFDEVGITPADIKSLADNLVIAFATTVIGLVVGGVCYAVMVIRSRWYRQDLSDLEYAVELLRGRKDEAA